MTKRSITVFILCLGWLSLLLSGCEDDLVMLRDEGSDSSLVGTWVYPFSGGYRDVYTFLANGTVTGQFWNGRSGTGTYSLAGSSITFTITKTTGTVVWYSGTVSGRTMTVNWRDSNGNSGTITGYRS